MDENTPTEPWSMKPGSLNYCLSRVLNAQHRAQFAQTELQDAIKELEAAFKREKG